MALTFERHTVEDGMLGENQQIVVRKQNFIVVAHLCWNDEEICDLWVDENYRRQGLAKQMYEAAGRPPHSRCRTQAGDSFAHAVGGLIPPLHDIPCEVCGCQPWDDF